MNFQSLTARLVLSLGTVLALSTAAQATTFNFSGTDKEKDITLNSITQNGVTFSNFNLVKDAVILSNTPITGYKAGDTSNPEASGRNNNTGAASTDKGDKASSVLPVSGMNNPTGAEIASFLGNTNLNNIIDTEDNGSFSINLFFDKLVRSDNTGLSNLFFLERGKNSDLGIQAIDAAGNAIGNFLKLGRTAQKDAGYSIDTLEISSAQKVGFWEIDILKQLGVSSLQGIRVTADDSYDGPDFKVIGRSVPEPTALAGIALVGGVLVASRRRKVQATKF